MCNSKTVATYPIVRKCSRFLSLPTCCFPLVSSRKMGSSIIMSYLPEVPKVTSQPPSNTVISFYNSVFWVASWWLKSGERLDLRRHGVSYHVNSLTSFLEQIQKWCHTINMTLHCSVVSSECIKSTVVKPGLGNSWICAGWHLGNFGIEGGILP